MKRISDPSGGRQAASVAASRQVEWADPAAIGLGDEDARDPPGAGSSDQDLLAVGGEGIGVDADQGLGRDLDRIGPVSSGDEQEPGTRRDLLSLEDKSRPVA